MDQQMITTAEVALMRLDPTLGRLIERQRPLPSRQRTGYFRSLCRSIIGQQVSVASASAIYARFEQVTGLDPTVVAALTDEQTKAIGLSRQKAGYLRDLGTHFAGRPDVYDHLEHRRDDEVITELVAIKGIGVWTAQMFLIFTLGRPDVFAPDDIGLQRAIQQLYKLSVVPPKAELVALAQRWAPYRSVASLHLWRSLDNEPN